jgi:hypothetical protein
MAIVPQLIARYASVLYALCALGVFFYVWAALQARHKGDLALFSMEREDAVNQGLHSWSMAGLCVLLIIGVYSVSNFIAPNFPLEKPEETPIVALQLTPIVSPTFPPTRTLASIPTTTRGTVATVAPIATPLDRPPDTPTPAPGSEGDGAPVQAACTSAGTQIISPGNGDQLWGVVEVRGTASLPDFSFYKFEIQWPDSDEWVTVQSFDIPVVGGVLGYWDTTPLAQEPGAYKFRLVVVDSTGNYPEPCVINVALESPTPES